MEYPKTKKKSRFFVHQYMRQDTLWNLSEKSFAVFYDGEWIQPKVRVGNHRIKEPTTIPPMTSFAISFKSKRQTGDTIHIIERNTPRQGDSIVMKVSLSEPGKRAEYADYENYFSFNQLSHNPQNIYMKRTFMTNWSLRTVSASRNWLSVFLLSIKTFWTESWPETCGR